MDGLTAAEWDHLKAHLLTWPAVEAVFLNTYTCLLYALLELPHSMVARFQEQVFKEKQAEIYYLLWPTQPYQEGRNIDSTIQYTTCHILLIK